MPSGVSEIEEEVRPFSSGGVRTSSRRLVQQSSSSQTVPDASPSSIRKSSSGKFNNGNNGSKKSFYDDMHVEVEVEELVSPIKGDVTRVALQEAMAESDGVPAPRVTGPSQSLPVITLSSQSPRGTSLRAPMFSISNRTLSVSGEGDSSFSPNGGKSGRIGMIGGNSMTGIGQASNEGASVGELDWYGNSILHHIVAPNDVNMAQFQSIVESHPHLLHHRNQFGRIPLHYILDRIKVNISCIRLYLQSFPKASEIADNDGITPYQLAVKWKHKRVIRRMLLENSPHLDQEAYLRLKYGTVVGSIAVWASSLGKNLSSPHAQIYAGERSSGEGEDYEEGDDETFDGDDVQGMSSGMLTSTAPTQLDMTTSGSDAVYAFQYGADNSLTPIPHPGGRRRMSINTDDDL